MATKPTAASASAAEVIWIPDARDPETPASPENFVHGLRVRGTRVLWLDEDNLSRLIGPEGASPDAGFVPTGTLVGLVSRGVSRGITFVLTPATPRLHLRELLKRAVEDVTEFRLAAA